MLSLKVEWAAEPAPQHENHPNGRPATRVAGERPPASKPAPRERPPAAMRAANALMACLREEGVDVAFGMPGGANLPTYDALRDAGIRHVLVRHEAAGGHAAEGYARATGRVGVCFATSGPGATNLVTPIADAMMDSVPTVFITGAVRTEVSGTDAFQEADVYGMTMPIVKHSFLIEDPRELPRTIREAFHLARSGRPGPVLIDIPVDLTNAAVPPPGPAPLDLPGYKPTTKGNGKQIRAAAAAIAAAHRPVLYAGGGVIAADAAPELTALATAARLPVTTTLMGLGGFPAPHRQWLGMLGMHGTRTANYAMDRADLIVAVGARFDDRITGKLSEFAPRARIVHIDIDPAEIGKNVAAHIPIVGDAKRILARLGAEPDVAAADHARLDPWWRQIDEWRERHPLRYEDGGDEIKPQRLIEAVYEATGGEAIVTTDVGQHQMWAAQHFHFAQPRRFITSGGLGTMGFGLPAAMGAAAGRPDELVVCITGDGSLPLNMQELITCGAEGIPVKVVIVNNGYLGMVRQQQELMFAERYSAVDLSAQPNWAALAAACGVSGIRLDDPATLVADLEAALAEPGPVVIDVPVVREENCYPMVMPGAAARDMVG